MDTNSFSTLSYIAAALLALTLVTPDAQAQSRNFSRSFVTGSSMNVNNASNRVSMRMPGTAVAARPSANGLPACTMDSFVYEAGEHAEHIYGDEGIHGLPPYEFFSETHRINTGIHDQRDQGLTTGHGSWMPDGWGRDEFLGQEMSLSGARGVSSSQGFVAGLPYRIDSVTPANPAQFPGGYRTSNWLNGQLDEDRWGDPLPVEWNGRTYKNQTWTQNADGSWTSDLGVTITPEGRIIKDGVIYYRDGTSAPIQPTPVQPDPSNPVLE